MNDACAELAKDMDLPFNEADGKFWESIVGLSKQEFTEQIANFSADYGLNTPLMKSSPEKAEANDS